MQDKKKPALLIGKVVMKVFRPTQLHPEIRKHIPSLPVRNGKIILSRKDPDHVAWMEEEGEEDLY